MFYVKSCAYTQTDDIAPVSLSPKITAYVISQKHDLLTIINYLPCQACHWSITAWLQDNQAYLVPIVRASSCLFLT